MPPPKPRRLKHHTHKNRRDTSANEGKKCWFTCYSLSIVLCLPRYGDRPWWVPSCSSSFVIAIHSCWLGVCDWSAGRLSFVLLIQLRTKSLHPCFFFLTMTYLHILHFFFFALPRVFQLCRTNRRSSLSPLSLSCSLPSENCHHETCYRYMLPHCHLVGKNDRVGCCGERPGQWKWETA